MLRPLILLVLLTEMMCAEKVASSAAAGTGTSSSSSSPVVQSFLREPFDQIATVGEHVTLPCRTVNKHGVLQWTRDDFGLGSDRDLEGFKRYKMTGSDEEGDYTLDINPVDLEDDGRFQCQVGASSDGVAPIRSRYAALTVLVPPEPPRIFPLGQALKTVQGREVELRCESRGGKPASEITWFDSDNTVITEGVQTVQELLEDSKRFRTVSILKFLAARHHHDRNVTCQAQNSANRKPLSTSIRLQVHYPPHVTLTANRDQILEGDGLKFSCSAQGNPDQLSFTWFVGGRKVTEAPETSSELVMDGVDRRMHGQTVKCEVSNSIGKTDAVKAIDVAYSPVFLYRPEDVAGVDAERVTLRCLVDSNPKPVYSWYHAQNRQHVLSHSSNLTFALNERTAGEYVCRASSAATAAADNNASSAFIEARASAFLKGPPSIVAPTVQHLPEGVAGSVVCRARSVPEAETVEWSFKGQPLIMSPGGGGRHSVADVRTPDGVESSLIVREVGAEDFGPYMCTVQNAFGTDSTVIQLKKQTTMPLVIIVSGVLGGIILTVAVIMIVILCRRNIACLRCLLRPTTTMKNGPLDKSSPQLPTTSSDLRGTKIGGSSGDSTGSDEKTSSSTTGSDGVSNNSSELKVEAARTSSSLSEEHWDRGSDDSFGPGVGGVKTFLHHHHQSGGHGTMKPSDYVDGLPRPFEHQSYYGGGGASTAVTNAPSSFYGQNLAQASAISSNSSGSHNNNSYANYNHGGFYSQQQENKDFAVHVRASPISPCNSSGQYSSNGHGGGGISVKNYGYYPALSPAAVQHQSMLTSDYVPASAFAVPVPSSSSSYHHYSAGAAASAADNYSVYVNGRVMGMGGAKGSGHEVVVPAVHQQQQQHHLAKASLSSNSGSLATHV